MPDPVNLNKVRKARAKAEKRAQADGNSVAFGRTKAEKQLEKARAEKARATLEAHRRDTPREPSGKPQ